jgi:hypothetical protein
LLPSKSFHTRIQSQRLIMQLARGGMEVLLRP